jgi:hypothetical protein
MPVIRKLLKSEWHELVQVADEDFDRLPKDMTGFPHFFNIRDGVIRVWPQLQEYDHLQLGWRAP